MARWKKCPSSRRRAPTWVLANGWVLWLAVAPSCSGGRFSAMSQSGDSVPNGGTSSPAEPGVAATAAGSPTTSRLGASQICPTPCESTMSDAAGQTISSPPSGVAGTPPAVPAISAELERLRREAQERVLGRALSVEEPARPFIAIEPEQALDHFHGALARLAAGQDEDGKVRILAYGASHTQADIYPGYLRTYLQSRFGDGGQGFVLLGRVNRWQQLRTMRGSQRAFTVRAVGARRDVRDEPLGLFGAALVSRRPDAVADVLVPKESSNTKFEVHYFEDVRGGDFALQVDGVTVAEIATASATPRPAFRAFETTAGAHRISVRPKGNGPIRLFGIIAETATSGVVVDTLGISGAQMGNNLASEEDSWIEAVRHRNPDLVTFAYGTNETADASLSVEDYELQLSAVLARLRKAAPETSCLLIAPFDGPARTRTRLLKILDVQRRVSREFGCGFWDGYAFMGGPGSMRRWAAAKPPLAAGDHIHLTHLGYVQAGVAIGDALMRGYDFDPLRASASAHSTAPAASCDPSLCP